MKNMHDLKGSLLVFFYN